MRNAAFVLALLIMPGLPASANEFAVVTELNDFMSTVQGRELRMGLFGVSLSILPDGTIDGSAAGWDLTGTWSWQDGYFCREMDWGGTEIPYNCQLVEVKDNAQIRFTVDQGAGDSADFTLR